MPATAPHRFVVPFADLLDSLRRQGFAIGVDHYLRIYALLERVGDECSPQQLKTLLCPLIATSREQQEQFYRIFDQQFGMLNDDTPTSIADDGEALLITGNADTDAPAGVRAQSPARATKKPTARKVLWRVALILGLIPILALIARLPWSGAPEASVPTTVETSAPSPTTDSPTPAAPGPVQPASPTAAPPTTKPETIPERQAPASTVPRTRFDSPFLKFVLLLLPIVGWLIIERGRERRRRLALRRERTGRPPFSWPVRVPLARQLYVGTSDIAETSRVVRAREASESRHLAINETIAATIAARGMPTLRYRRGTRSPEYLMLIERTSDADHHAQLFAHLASSLAREGVHVTTYFHDGDPRVCFSATEEDATLLTALRYRFSTHRLLLFGMGDRLVDPLSVRLHPWVEGLMDWRDRVLLTPEPIAGWGIRENTLSKHFVVLPASVDGLRAAGEILVSPDRSSGTRGWPGDVHPTMQQVAMADTVANLRTTLSDGVFEWLCACALYPELHWELTLFIGALPCLREGLVTESNLLQLIRLPWFRRGSIPDDIRLALINALPLPVAQAVRAALVQVLEQHAPPDYSAAAPRHQLNLAMQRLLSSASDVGKRSALARELEGMSERELLQDRVYLRLLAPHVRGPLALLLPQALRKSLRGIGAPGFSGNRALTLGTIAALCLLFMIPLSVSWLGNRRLTSQVTEAERAVEALPAPRTTSGTIALPTVESLRQLEVLRAHLETLGAYVDSGPPLRLRFGFWRGEALLAEARQVWSRGYRRQLHDDAWRTLVDSLRALPAAPLPTSDYGRSYDRLKTYLVGTTEHARSTPIFVTPTLLAAWQRGLATDSVLTELARRQIDEYATLRARDEMWSVASDAMLVSRARAFLNAFAGIDAIYAALLSSVSARVMPIALLDSVPQAAGVVSTGGVIVPGPFTAAGWTAMQDALQNSERLLQDETWVLGDRSLVASRNRDQDQTAIRTRFASDYVAQWRAALRALSVARPGSVKESAAQLGKLGGAQSPLLALLSLVARNTSVDTALVRAFQPVHVVTPPSVRDRLVSEANAPYANGLLSLRNAMERLGDLPPGRDSASRKALEAAVTTLFMTEASQARLGARQLEQQFSMGDPSAAASVVAVQTLIESPIDWALNLVVSLDVPDSALTAMPIAVAPTGGAAAPALGRKETAAPSSDSTSARPMETLMVAPTSFWLRLGDAGQVVVLITDSLGAFLRSGARFTSTDSRVVSVSASGAVRAVGVGRAFVNVQGGAQSRRIPVSVTLSTTAPGVTEPLVTKLPTVVPAPASNDRQVSQAAKTAGLTVAPKTNAPPGTQSSVVVGATIEPTGVQLLPTERLRPILRLRYADSAVAESRDVVWGVEGSAIAIDPSSREVIGLTPGTGLLVGRFGTTSTIAFATVTVVEPNLVPTPDPLVIAAGAQDTVYMVVPTQGRRRVTQNLRWRSTDPDILRVLNPASGIVQALSPGTADLIVDGYGLVRRIPVTVTSRNAPTPSPTSTPTASGAALAVMLNARGKDLCNEMERILRRFPFDPDGGDASISDVNALLAPSTGALWRFYDERLAPMLPLENRVFVAKPANGIALSPTFVAFFRRMARASVALYADRGQTPRLSLALRAIPATDLSMITLTHGDRTLRWPGAETQTVTWPATGRNTARLTIVSGGKEQELAKADGPWALFRLIARGRAEGRGTTIRVTFNGNVPTAFELSAPDAGSVVHRGALAGQECVSQVTQ